MTTHHSERYAKATNAVDAFVMIKKLGQVERVFFTIDGVANGRRYSAIHVDYCTGNPLTIWVSAKTAREFSKNYRVKNYQVESI